MKPTDESKLEGRFVEDLTAMAASMRKDCLRMGLAAGGAGAHMGGSLSCVEIIAALFGRVMSLADNLSDSNNDRFIMSKGHGILAQYAALHQLGFIEDSELDTFKSKDSRLTAHPAVNPDLGIDFATGSLGQGLSLGVGISLAFKQKGSPQKTFVLLGDGECDEGSVWEAVMTASQWKLDNLCAIVDANGLQYDTSLDDVIALDPLAAKWTAFGWSVIEVDGHNPYAIAEALMASEKGKPLAVIAKTVKGKGVSFMENDPMWHAQRVTREVFDAAMMELGD